MKHILSLLLCLCSAGAMAQHCPNVSWTLPDPVVCDVNYGDASGNSPWNWEIDRLDPNYCKMWYARVGAGQIIPIGSPFMSPSAATLAVIASAKDYTKEKGWVLLKRNFGCEAVVNYPFFVLYNTYRGVIRVFVYQPATAAASSGLMVVVAPDRSPYPALTAMADPVAGSIDQFRYENATGSYGRSLVAVGEQAGPSSWTMAEFQIGFDPNVDLYDYTGVGLQFKIYNVSSFEMKAVINGRMVTGTDPKLYNYNYVPATTPEQLPGGLEKFVATGEKVVKVAKKIGEGREDIHKAATDLASKLSGATGVKKRIGNVASGIAKITDDASGFGKTLSEVVKGIGVAGSVLSVLGNVMGVFSDSEPAITYSSINMELTGSLTAKDVGQTFIIRVPGSRKDPNDPQDYVNRPYYDCPLGIVALKNIPRADLITYRRAKSDNGYPDLLGAYPHYHKSYRLKNNLVLAVNEKAGLELVSAQVAFVGEIQPSANPLFPGKPGYLPLIEHQSGNINFMLPDFQNGRLEIANYDSLGFHTFRTAYADIGCANGLTFNVLDPTYVYLRVIAVLKRKNDPAATPIIFSKDYAVKTDNVTLPQATIDMYLSNTVGHTANPPYTNLTVLPNFQKDIKLENAYLSNGAYFATDANIYTAGSLISPSNAQNVVLNAGDEISLNPGFEAGWGTTFTAQINRYGYSLTCITPVVENYNAISNCYNTAGIPGFKAADGEATFTARNEESISIYPVPSKGMITVNVKGLPASSVTVSDLSGKTVHQQSLPNAVNNLDLNHLPNGTYFIKIIYPGKIVVKKIMLNK